MLWLAFRWFAGAALAGTAVGFSMTLAIGLMAFVREPLNIINNILPVLLIVIGMSDGIHLISRFGEESSERSDKREAAFHAVRTMTAACFLTSFTTAIGFASLVSRTEILQALRRHLRGRRDDRLRRDDPLPPGRPDVRAEASGRPREGARRAP